MHTTWRLRNGRRLMALSFPNQSRAYDATRRAVRFWGNDSAMEASFFVTEDSLKRIQPDMRFDEAGLLAAFDLNRLLIYATAAKVYGRGHKGSYNLLPDDF
jgi:Protein of unknown function (DUF1488)